MHVPMKHITLVAMARYEHAIMARLQALGSLEVSSIEEQATPKDVQEELQRASSALKFLKAYDIRKSRPFSNLPDVGASQLLAEHDPALEVITKAEALEQRIAAITAEMLQVASLSETLQPWESLPYPLESIKESEQVRFLTGFLNAGAVTQVTQADELIAVDIYGAGRGSLLAVFIAVHRSHGEQGLNLLASLGWVDASFPHLTGTAQQNLLRLAEKKQALLDETEAVRAQATELATTGIVNLEIYYDALLSQGELYAAQGKLGYSETTFRLQGWLPAVAESEVRNQLDAITDSYWWEARDPLDEEQPPTLLENHPLAQPFEGITALFSLPNYREADITNWMAITYWILFGIMLGDFGYGLALFVLTFAILRVYQPPEGKKSLIWMLNYCGISTMIWGALFGGYFGESLLPPLLFNPMENPINALILSYGLGVLHILIAMFLKIKALVKEGKALDAFLDVGMWVIVIFGCIMFALPPTSGIALNVVLFGMAGVVLTHGRSSPSFFGKIAGGFGSLYGISGYLSDVLSYSRLFALGLTGGVIGMVFNIICAMVLEIPILGIPIGLVLLLALHTVNLVLSSLGSYVHTCRLQYIEFFGKFYEGGGRAFKPLAYKLQYGRLTDRTTS